MTGRNKSIGKRGEDAAAAYLQQKGYTIIGRNYRAGRGEIDIVALHDKTLVFIEVKSNATMKYGLPEERVHRKKQQQIARIAQCFMEREDLAFDDCRFDVISVTFQKEVEINHIKDAFLAQRDV